MSIHQAKGLEFPIVVLPDLNRQDHAGRGRLGVDLDLGLIVKPLDEPDPEAGIPVDGKSLGWQLHGFRERRAEAAESLRLFYVATTRGRMSWCSRRAGMRRRSRTRPR